MSSVAELQSGKDHKNENFPVQPVGRGAPASTVRRGECRPRARSPVPSSD